MVPQWFCNGPITLDEVLESFVRHCEVLQWLCNGYLRLYDGSALVPQDIVLVSSGYHIMYWFLFEIF